MKKETSFLAIRHKFIIFTKIINKRAVKYIDKVNSGCFPIEVLALSYCDRPVSLICKNSSGCTGNFARERYANTIQALIPHKHFLFVNTITVQFVMFLKHNFLQLIHTNNLVFHFQTLTKTAVHE